MRSLILTALLVGLTTLGFCQKLGKPFPNHTQYSAGSVLPANFSQKEKDKVVIAFYDSWKRSYVKNDCKDPGLYYTYTDEGDVTPQGPVVCVSEGQGFGMLITVVMAGYDKDAQKIFDGMYRFVQQYPTSKSHNLMTWSIVRGCDIRLHKTGDQFDNTSATDGDLDVALSLLMADAQWGSRGAINYREEAMKRISAILEFEVNKKAHTLLLGDANDEGDFDFYDIRTSDFMPTHLKVFERYLPNAEWKKVVDHSYQIFKAIQKKYSPKAGLIPDFIIYRKNQYKPAGSNYLEGKEDGDFFYNACRVPLRLGMDYLLCNDERAKMLLKPMNEWVRTVTNGDVKKMYAGYYLDGRRIPKYYYTVPSFISSMAVGSMANGPQSWTDNSWKGVCTFKITDFKYYDNTLHMLSLIVLSGNFWLP